MTWLKKVGETLLKGLEFGEQLLIGAQPFLKMAAPKLAAVDEQVAGDIEQMIHMASLIEVAGQAFTMPGTQKFTQAIPLIGQIVAGSTAVLGKDVQDKALYDKAIAGFTQATVDLANSFHPKVETIKP